MSEYQSILEAASQLPLSDRLRLINDLTASVPDDHPPQLSGEWLAEIERRSAELDSGATTPEAWSNIRQRLFQRHGITDAD